MAIVSILSVVTCFRYELAIALPKEDTDGFHVAIVSICFSILTSALCLILLLNFKHSAALWLNAPLLENYLLMLPASVLFVGVYNSCRYWAIRKDRYTSIGKTRLTQVIGSLITQITGAGLGVISLFLGQLASQFLGIISLGRLLITSAPINTFKFVKLKRVLVRYKRFPLFSTWSALLNTTSTELPTLFLAISYGPSAAGFYALASRILRTPVTVISGSIASVFLSGAAKAKRDGNLTDLTKKVYSKLVDVAMPMMALLALVAPDLFSIIFGESWHQAGIYARWMSLWIFLVFVTSPLHFLFTVLERQDHEFIYQVSLFLLRALALSIGIKAGGAVFTIALFCIASALCQLGFLIWMKKHLALTLSDLVSPIIKGVCWSFLVSIPIFTYYFLTQNDLIFTACLVISAVILMFSLIHNLKQYAR